MKSFLVSVAITLILILSWGLCIYSSTMDVEELSRDIDTVHTMVVEGQWKHASSLIEDSHRSWERKRNSFNLFLNRDSIVDVNDKYLRCIDFIDAKDVSNSSGELSSLKESIQFLLKLEKPTLYNII